MKHILLFLLIPTLVFAQQQPQNYVYNPGATTPIARTPGQQSKQSTDGNGNSYVIALTAVPVTHNGTPQPVIVVAMTPNPLPVNISGTPINVNTPIANWPVNVSGTPINVNTPIANWPVSLQGTPAAVAPPFATPAWVRLAVPAATVPSAYTPTAAGVTGLSNTAPLVFCRVRDDTDQPVSISASGGTNDDLPAVAAKSTEIYDFGSNGKVVNTSLVVKYVATPPTSGSGSVYIDCH